MTCYFPILPILLFCAFSVLSEVNSQRLQTTLTQNNPSHNDLSRVHQTSGSAIAPIHFPSSTSSSSSSSPPQEHRNHQPSVESSTPGSAANLDYDSIRIRIGNLTRASDFFALLRADEPMEIDPIDHRSRRPARQAFTDQAACEPEMRSIDLSNYTHTAEDPDVAVFPRCIRVPRCGGCCGPNDLVECLPTRVTLKDVRRALVRLNVLNEGRRRRESSMMETIQVEYHEECSCQCRQKETDCDPNRHVYQADKCKCVCSDFRAEMNCINEGSHRMWDSRECVCRCRHQRHCSTGLRFSHETCRCEME